MCVRVRIVLMRCTVRGHAGFGNGHDHNVRNDCGLPNSIVYRSQTTLLISRWTRGCGGSCHWWTGRGLPGTRRRSRGRWAGPERRRLIGAATSVWRGPLVQTSRKPDYWWWDSLGQRTSRLPSDTEDTPALVTR